jgi:hypothetical protein
VLTLCSKKNQKKLLGTFQNNMSLAKPKVDEKPSTQDLPTVRKHILQILCYQSLDPDNQFIQQKLKEAKYLLNKLDKRHGAPCSYTIEKTKPKQLKSYRSNPIVLKSTIAPLPKSRLRAAAASTNTINTINITINNASIRHDDDFNQLFNVVPDT